VGARRPELRLHKTSRGKEEENCRVAKNEREKTKRKHIEKTKGSAEKVLSDKEVTTKSWERAGERTYTKGRGGSVTLHGRGLKQKGGGERRG